MKANRIYVACSSALNERAIRCRRARGFTMIELLVTVTIVMIVLGFSIPIITTSLNNMHLGSAASSLSGAIQSTRYLAISVGCPYQFTVVPASNSYQLATEAISGNPPACASTYTNVGSPIPFANSDVTIPATTTFLLNPSGTVSAVATPTVSVYPAISIVLAHGATTKTVTVTGVGNVKVTAP